MARLLHLHGFQVHTACTCSDALRLCDDNGSYDLLISDVGLPDGTGYDLMRQIMDRACTTKGIAVSGYGTEHDVEESIRAGFALHLVKPIEFNVLRDAIQRVIAD